MNDPEPNSNEAKAQISEMIGALATMYPREEISTENCKAYAVKLCDIPVSVLIVVLDQCGAEMKWFPSVAEIREKARLLTSQDALPAFQAWAIVQKAFSETRWGHSPEFNDPIIAEAVRCLGWNELCNSENQVADRAHFAKIYDQLVARRESDERLLPAARELKQLNRGQPIIAQLVGRKG